MKIVRGRLSAADLGNPSYRYDATCDCIQYTPDGGSTWVDAPGNDPRHAPQFLKPPVAGSNKQCDAAANMVKWLKDFIDQVTAIMEAGALVTAVINKLFDVIATLYPPSDLLVLIAEVAGTIFDFGSVALEAAFTSDQYDLLQCIFFCRADADGRISAAALARVESDITAQLNTTAALVTNAILFVQCEIGLSNAGSIGSETGDCDDCGCNWCQFFDFSTGQHGFDVTPGEAGSYDGTKFVGAEFNANSNTEIVINNSFTAGTVNYVAFEFLKSAGSGSNNVVVPLLLLGGALAWSGTVITTDGDHQHYSSDVPNVEADELLLVVNAGTSGGATAIYNAQLEGIDTSPFGENNC